MKTDEKNAWRRILMQATPEKWVELDELFGRTLTPREAKVLHLRFANGEKGKRSLKAVGLALGYPNGCSAQNILRVETKALTKLRHPARSRRVMVLLFAGETPPSPE